jgi:23S rRNA (pseudouridine1915-N3)-methyltransferase
MKVSIFAVGRMKAGPERDLVERFLDRFSKAAPGVGMAFSGLGEIPESRRQSAEERRREESATFRAQHAGKTLIILDETGRNLGSEVFAGKLEALRDGGHREIVFAIGGPDGHDPGLRAEAELSLAFGAATWPHQIARIMLAEQLYRAVTILSGHPYHRGEPAKK